ncbi:MAG: spore coat protein [Bacillota bacterium]
MPNLTSKELSRIDDQLGIEKMLVEKFARCANMCTDQTIKQRLSQIQQMHQRHYDTLLSHVTGGGTLQ